MRLLCAWVVLLSVFSSGAFGWKVFHLGKHWGQKHLENQLSASSSFADIWFDQKLDHFDPTNGDKWKQVRIFFNLIELRDPENFNNIWEPHYFITKTRFGWHDEYFSPQISPIFL
jgi:hypothetical protein